MQAEEKIKNLNQFLEEQLWYIQTIAKDQNINLGAVRSLRGTTKEKLEAAFWTLQDVKSVLEGIL